MSKQFFSLILYLLISLVTGIIVTLAMDNFENITVEKKIRKELEQEIRVAASSIKNYAEKITPKEEVSFVKEFSASALGGKIIVYDSKHAKKPDPQKFVFLFTYKTGDERLDFYIRNSYLKNELAILDIPELIFGLFITIIVFTCIILYTEKKKQAVVLHQQFEVKHAEIKKVLEEHEALALLGRMVASLAHEIKTPIATISNLIQVIPDRVGDERFINRFVALVVEELSRIQQLISNLLAYGKEIEVKQEEWIDFHIFLNEIALKNSLQLKLSSFIKIYGDIFLLSLLFDNLMRNSKNEGADTVQVKVSNPKEDFNTEIMLEDNGNGFTTDVDLNTLLNPFITCHSSGAGLGLYLARRVADAHDGDIKLYRIEHGAVVKVTLPKKRVLLHE